MIRSAATEHMSSRAKNWEIENQLEHRGRCEKNLAFVAAQPVVTRRRQHPILGVVANSAVFPPLAEKIPLLGRKISAVQPSREFDRESLIYTYVFASPGGPFRLKTRFFPDFSLPQRNQVSSCSESNVALPPAAVVSVETVRSVAKRCR